MKALPIVIAAFLSCWPNPCQANDEPDTLALIVNTIEQTDDSAIQASLIRGILSGLDGQRNVQAPPTWKRISAKLAKSSDANVRHLSDQLSQLFGDRAAMMRSLATASDAGANIAARRKALQSLLDQQVEEVGPLLEKLLDDPAMRLDAIRGYAAIEHPFAPELLLGLYPKLDESQQRAVIETLATRKPYAAPLLAALKNESIPKQAIPPHVARSMSLLLGDEFTSAFGDVRQLAADRQKAMAEYKKLITPDAMDKADASRGRVVFQKTCASCHLLYGEGAKIGPDLTGSNRANLDYILLNSIDPSYDVPDGYKMVMIQTVDGRLVSGVIAEEDSRRVVLKTVEQPRVTIAKEDIERRKVSAKSMMPDGQLDQLKPRQVLDLIKYLRTTEQVEPAK